MRTSKPSADSGLDRSRSTAASASSIEAQTDDIQAVLAQPPHGGPPTLEFWRHWANVARVWAMVSGRADAGGTAEEAELARWARHRLITEDGWRPVREALRRLYGPPAPDREAFVATPVTNVWAPIEIYGRAAWASS